MFGITNSMKRSIEEFFKVELMRLLVWGELRFLFTIIHSLPAGMLGAFLHFAVKQVHF